MATEAKILQKTNVFRDLAQELESDAELVEKTNVFRDSELELVEKRSVFRDFERQRDSRESPE